MKSVFNHIINNRTFSKAYEINNQAEKEKVLKNIIEHIIPGILNDIRKPTEKELNATSLFYIELNEVSAKIKNDLPIDDEEDLKSEIWLGILPLKVINEESV